MITRRSKVAKSGRKMRRSGARSRALQIGCRRRSPMRTTSDVINQHLKAFGGNDLDGILADYSPEAVLFTPGGPLKGPAEIKPFFQAFLTEFAKPGASFSLQQQYAEGEYAYILWTAETADNSFEA